MTDTFQRLTAILIKDYKLKPEQLSPEAPLEALGIDSLGTVELLWSVEDAFRIKLPSEPVPLATLGDVAAYVDRLMAEQAAAALAGTTADPAASSTAAHALPEARSSSSSSASPSSPSTPAAPSAPSSPEVPSAPAAPTGDAA